ncbi:MAG: hypothetical protein CSA45_06835 [Gammaproteobacteria bacterium]|nr:MAG: hypothetical protein CSA45_06835 [Gammaproteobacteria bacterium]
MKKLIVIAISTWLLAFFLLVIISWPLLTQLNLWLFSTAISLFCVGLIAWLILWRSTRVAPPWQQLAYQDALTGLLNRRGFAAQRLAPPYCCLLIDLDNFKHLNDYQGHTTGDALLQQFAQCLQDNSRHHDLCVRWGGDEFLVVLQDADRRAGAVFIQRLRSKLSTLDTVLSISVGCADSQDGDTPQAVIALADQRLLAAKQQRKADSQNQPRK